MQQATLSPFQGKFSTALDPLSPRQKKKEKTNNLKLAHKAAQ
jgi:hypothetical protein